MKLIEQLGGYEKAKEIVFDPLHPQMTHVSNDGRHWVNENFSYISEIQSQIPKMARIDDIRKALLEYRRQHNIFEVGDRVVFEAHFCDEHKGSGCGEITYCTMDKRVFEIDSYYLVSIDEIRHATDAEIKAGKRLEVNQ